METQPEPGASETEEALLERMRLLEERLGGETATRDELTDRITVLETAATSGADTRVDGLFERLDAIESSGGTGAAAGAATSDLIKRVEGLEAVAALEAADGLAGGKDTRVDDLLARLDLIESVGLGPDGVVEDLTNRMLAIEEKSEAAAPDPRVQELLTRISTVEGRIEEANSDSQTGAIAERLNQLEGKLTAEPPPTDLTARLARVEEIVTQNSQADLSDLLTEMAQKIDALDRQVSEGIEAAPAGDGGGQKAALEMARVLGDRIAESLQGAAPGGMEGKTLKALESQMFGAYVWLGLASGIGLMAFLFLR